MSARITINIQHIDPEKIETSKLQSGCYTLMVDGVQFFLDDIKQVDVLIAALAGIRQALEREVRGRPDCEACHGTGLVQVQGEPRPEICALCFPPDGSTW